MDSAKNGVSKLRIIEGASLSSSVLRQPKTKVSDIPACKMAVLSTRIYYILNCVAVL